MDFEAAIVIVKMMSGEGSDLKLSLRLFYRLSRSVQDQSEALKVCENTTIPYVTSFST